MNRQTETAAVAEKQQAFQKALPFYTRAPSPDSSHRVAPSSAWIYTMEYTIKNNFLTTSIGCILPKETTFACVRF